MVFIFMVVRALAGSWARKRRHAFADFLNGLNLRETSVINLVIIANCRKVTKTLGQSERTKGAHRNIFNKVRYVTMNIGPLSRALTCATRHRPRRICAKHGSIPNFEIAATSASSILHKATPLIALR